MPAPPVVLCVVVLACLASGHSGSGRVLATLALSGLLALSASVLHVDPVVFSAVSGFDSSFGLSLWRRIHFTHCGVVLGVPCFIFCGCGLFQTACLTELFVVPFLLRSCVPFGVVQPAGGTVLFGALLAAGFAILCILAAFNTQAEFLVPLPFLLVVEPCSLPIFRGLTFVLAVLPVAFSLFVWRERCSSWASLPIARLFRGFLWSVALGFRI